MRMSEQRKAEEKSQKFNRDSVACKKFNRSWWGSSHLLMRDEEWASLGQQTKHP